MKRFVFTGLIFLVLLLGICSAAADDSSDYAKIVVVHLTINKSSITEKLVEMRYGHTPNIEGRSGDFKGTLKSADGSTLREFNLWDPRYQLGDVLEKANESSGYLSGYLTYSDNADLVLILPYYENQMTFELYDKKTGMLLKKVNMSQAITKFQSVYPKDPGSVSVHRANSPGVRKEVRGRLSSFFSCTGTTSVRFIAVDLSFKPERRA